MWIEFQHSPPYRVVVEGVSLYDEVEKKSEIRWFCVFTEPLLLLECEIIVMFEYQKFYTRSVARWAISFIEGVISAAHDDDDCQLENIFYANKFESRRWASAQKSAAILNKVAVNINVLL